MKRRSRRDSPKPRERKRSETRSISSRRRKESLLKRPKRGLLTSLIVMTKKRKYLKHLERPLGAKKLHRVETNLHQEVQTREVQLQEVQLLEVLVWGQTKQKIQQLKLEKCIKRLKTNMNLLQNKARVLEISCKLSWMSQKL